MFEGSDLELAKACVAGDQEAIAEVEARFASDIARALARLRVDTALADDVKQTIREKLFLGTNGKPPGLASYSGKGPLGAFLRAVVVHAVISMKRARRRMTEADSRIRDVAHDDDPALEHVRRRYGASFKQAFQDAFAELSARERSVLRLVYIDGLAVEQVATVYGVHRVSVSRWLGQIREQLHSRTRELLRERLGLATSEVASVARLCLSQIDVSLSRLVRESSA
ncbi:putative DNA-binding regulatory protein [Labilithrix luteola]|uniref:Putative DNA-binding regulatory protein n=1 Tax=Labilithrix luteola TaxID=1391654 RepID=A0A0K1QAX7_9BACT|nr:sigma-70 family RNA polymerase sigma factor [Labilithrix luteola]AKV02888.1 putative DNA-binding regulatory protein [Labilithrix luteola]